MLDIEKASIKELNEKCNLYVTSSRGFANIFVDEVSDDIMKRIKDDINSIEKNFLQQEDKIDINEKVLEVLIKYEKYIDKRKLVLLSYYNYQAIKEMPENRDNPIYEYLQRIEHNHIEYLDSIKNPNFGYICVKKNGNQEVICLHDVYSREDLTTKEDMRNILKKLSNKTIATLILENIKETDMFVGENLIENMVENIIQMALEKRIGKSLEEVDRINNKSIFEDFCKSNTCNKALKDQLIALSRYIKMVEMCFDRITELYIRIEHNKYNNEERRKEMEKMLKELCMAIEGENIKLFDIEYDSKFLKMIEQQFKGNKFYTREEIKQIMEANLNEKQKLDSRDKILIKSYIINRDRIINERELKCVLDNNIFTKSELLEMVKNNRISLDTIEKLTQQNETIEIITDEQFLDEYYALKSKVLKVIKEGKIPETDLLKENERFDKIIDLYKSTNLSGLNREEHLNNILQHIDKDDIEEFKHAELITDEDVENYRKKKREEERKEFNKKLKSSEGMKELLESGDIEPIDIVVGAENKKIDKKIFIDMFLTGKVDFNMIKEYAKKHRVNGIISEQDIISEIAERQGTQNYDKEIQLLELYRRCINKPEEKQIYGLYIDEALEEKGENVTSLEDKRKLYNAGIISIDSIIDENNEEQIDNVLNNPILKIKDIQELYNRKIINDENIEHVLLANKVKFIHVILEEFNRQADDKHKNEGKKIVSEILVMIREMLIKNQEVEIEAIQDGHIIIHLPNVENGKRIIVQLYEMDNNNIVKTKNGGQAYVIDDYEYIMRKDEIIKNQSIDKLEIGKLLKQRVVDKISSKNIIEVAGKKESNSIYSLEEKDKVKELGNKAQKEIQQD